MVAIWTIWDFAYKFLGQDICWYADDSESQAWNKERWGWVKNQGLIGEDDEDDDRDIVEKILENVGKAVGAYNETTKTRN